MDFFSWGINDGLFCPGNGLCCVSFGFVHSLEPHFTPTVTAELRPPQNKDHFSVGTQTAVFVFNNLRKEHLIIIIRPVYDSPVCDLETEVSGPYNHDNCVPTFDSKAVFTQQNPDYCGQAKCAQFHCTPSAGSGHVLTDVHFEAWSHT